MLLQLHQLKTLLFMVLTMFLLSYQAVAQQREQYTGNNIILISLGSAKGMIDYRSDDLQVRYIKQTKKIECRLPVSTLYALNDTIPSDMAYEVLFGAKWPELVFMIDAPDEIMNAPRSNAEPQLQRTTIEIQGTANETKIPVVFTSDKGVINLSTNFDLRLQHFRATVPAGYASVLNGRLQVTIRNARWLDNIK